MNGATKCQKNLCMLSTLHAGNLQDVAWKSVTRFETKAGIIVALVGAGHQRISHTLQAWA